MPNAGQRELLPPADVTVVTGAAGWFGRAFLDAIARPTPDQGPVAREGEVRVLAATPSEVPLVLEVLPSAVVHVGDVVDADVLADLFRGASGASVVHAAGVIHPDRVAEFERVNHLGTRTVLEAAARVGVRRFVHVSSNSPFGTNPRPDDAFRQHEPYRPYLGYGRSKMRAELAVEAAHARGDVPAVILRPPWFYGPWQPARQTRFFSMVAAGRFPVPGSGDQRRSMTYVDNLVQAVALAERQPDAPGEAFWVADREAYPLTEIVDTVRAVLAEEGLLIRGPSPRVPRLLAAVAGRADRALQDRGRYSAQLHVLGELAETIRCDVSRTVEVLGYDPQVALAEGMRRSVRWCLERGLDLGARADPDVRRRACP